MSLKNKIESRLNQKKNKDTISILTYALCKTFHWDYWTLMKQPLPFIWTLVDQMQREAKEQEKEMKKSKRGRR